MAQIIPVYSIKLYDLEENFVLERTDDERFYREWRDDLPELKDWDNQALDEVKADY